MGKIDYGPMTERELLILVADKANETVDHLARLNSTVEKHEKRITILEANNPKKPRLNWQMISALIIVTGGAMYAICHFI